MTQGFNQDSDKFSQSEPESFPSEQETQPPSPSTRENLPPKPKPDIRSSKKPEENLGLEIVKTLGMAIVLALGIRTFVAEARYIPSESMVPTLIKNDRLIIEKISYHFREPQRGDVVVFAPTETLRAKGYKDAFIKRVIGLPGDKVEVRNGIVYVNDRPLSENYIAEQPAQDYGPQVVPPEQYLVMGDNRNNSYDSRAWGFVTKEDLIGRAVVRFWPIDRVGTLDKTPLYPDGQN